VPDRRLGHGTEIKWAVPYQSGPEAKLMYSQVVFKRVVSCGRLVGLYGSARSLNIQIMFFRNLVILIKKYLMLLNSN
jgi:hypothetical protein